MSKKQSYILGSIIAIVVSGLCAWAGSVVSIDGLGAWFGVMSFVIGILGVILLLVFIGEL